MMKKLLSVFVLAMIVMATLCGFAFPADMSGDRYVYDEGDYLSASEEAEIQAAIEQVSGDIKADILVIFTDQPESDSERNCAENAAKRWRDAGYASKKKQETIVFYVDMANRRFFTNEYNAKEKFRLTDADIDNITYKKYSVSNSIDDTLEKIVSESTILKNTPKLEQNNFQVSYYASDLKRKRVDLWNLLYNVPMYYGCIIIENAREIYYIEYEIELWSARTPIGLILEQMFYSVESNDKIDVMLFFSEECMAMPD